RPSVHRGPPVARNEAVGRPPAQRARRVLELAQEIARPHRLRREHHRVLVRIFAEGRPLTDLLRVGGEGSLGIDRGGKGCGDKHQGADHKPSGSARPARRCAATTVLRKRQAIVIGPTPPGTEVIARATSSASSNATSPSSLRVPSGCSTRSCPTSMTVAPRLSQEPLTNSGRPTAATTMSERLTASGRLRV